MRTYILLTGAKANVGDFLIVNRAKQLLSLHVRNARFIEIPRWQSLDQYLDEVNTSSGIILCGGPAYQPNMYPDIYPLVKDLDAIRVPIIPFGLGWKGFPGDNYSLERYRFSKSSLTLLQRIHNNCKVTSVRDYLTRVVLKRHGFTNVVMTGDPAWYDVNYLERPFVPPQKIQTIALSMPARPIYHNQSIDLAVNVRKLFPDARIICTFHHGWENSPFVHPQLAREQWLLMTQLSRRGFETLSLAGNLSAMESTYSEADIHVGYRLHAHLFFLSQRKPSFLLEEDGRGRGASEALGLRGIPAYTRIARGPVAVLSMGKKGTKIEARDDAVWEVIEMVEEEVSNGFARFKGLHEIFMAYYQILIEFLVQL